MAYGATFVGAALGIRPTDYGLEYASELPCFSLYAYLSVFRV